MIGGCQHVSMLQVPGESEAIPHQVPMLLPHEIIDAVWHAGDFQDRGI